MTDQHPVGSRLDPWIESYAARTAGMKVSEIRALFAVASRPEVVSLAGGMPNIGALPMDLVGDTVQRLLHDQGLTALQYSSGQGDERLRDQLLEVMALEGIDAHPDDIVMTTGSQQALDLVARVFLDPRVGSARPALAPGRSHGRSRRRGAPLAGAARGPAGDGPRLGGRRAPSVPVVEQPSVHQGRRPVARPGAPPAPGPGRRGVWRARRGPGVPVTSGGDPERPAVAAAGRVPGADHAADRCGLHGRARAPDVPPAPPRPALRSHGPRGRHRCSAVVVVGPRHGPGRDVRRPCTTTPATT